MEDESSCLTTPRAWITSVTFSDDNTVSLSENDIVVFVGPNNAGKSRALQDIIQKARDKKNEGIVIKDIEMSMAGTQDDLVDWLLRSSRKSSQDPSNPVYTRLGASVNELQARAWWQNSSGGFHQLASFFVYHLTTENRLTAANPAPNIALARAPRTNPIHYLQVDDSLESKISGYFNEAFGHDLIVHRCAGNEVPLHCGKKPTPQQDEDRVSLGYLRELEKLPTLHSQGDGMRSFVGVLLHTLVIDHSVILIDEPEAFLHPPQARLMGQMLIKEVPSDRQLFIATHSGDFLKGLLDGNSPRVRIVRIQHKDMINPIKELDNPGVTRVWKDPILRYSNVLDGLFHSKVIICESDSDCRFYNAIMDALIEPNEKTRREHVMFLHCGGKARMPVVIRALRNLDVPVNVVSDFDLLNSESPISEICEAMGIGWTEQREDWALVKSSIDQKRPELDSVEVVREIQQLLATVQEKYFPKDTKKDIETVLRKASPWAHAKTIGKNFVPSGDPTVACERLFRAFEEKGLFVVPVGELEGFCRSVGNHGPKWVSEVLEKKDIAEDPELDEAKTFVRKLVT
jgi:predicted ATPase